ncbi:MAG: nitroreductase family protein, partial [Gemmatimonadota bacterium]
MDADLMGGAPNIERTMLVSAFDMVVESRKSIRAFRPDPVPRQLIADILDIAARAPSTFNTQPWRTHIVTGA